MERLKNYFYLISVIFLLTNCTDSEFSSSDKSSSSIESVRAEDILPGILPPGVLIGEISQLPPPFNGNGCGLNQILEWIGSDWQCVDKGTASSVLASDVQAGTFSSGVLLPASQISGLLNPLSQLNGSTCSPGQILESNGVNFTCINQSTAASSVPASGVSAGSFGAGVIMPPSQIGAGALNTSTTILSSQISNNIGLSQLAPGNLPTGINLSSISQLPAPLNGSTCGANELLQWNGSNWVCSSTVSGDNLGNHQLTQNLVLGSRYISGDGQDEGIFVNEAGNVGIGGFTTPTVPLHIQSNPAGTAATFGITNASDNPRLNLRFDEANNKSILDFNGSSSGRGAISFRGNEEIQLSSSGIAIGDSATVQHGRRLSISSDWEHGTIFSLLNDEVGNNLWFLQATGSGNGGGPGRLNITGPGSALFTFNSGGNLGIGTNNPTAKLTVDNGSTIGTYEVSGWMHSSDSRLKRNILPLDKQDSLSKILDLNPVSYVFINDSENKEQVGFIAQEVDPILGEVVSKDKETGLFRMAYGNLVAPLISAFQELFIMTENNTQRIEVLESKNRSLEEMNQSLLRRIEALEKSSQRSL